MQESVLVDDENACRLREHRKQKSAVVSRSTSWKIADLIDFEIQLACDPHAAGARDAMAKCENQLLRFDTGDRQAAFKIWLEAMRGGDQKNTFGKRYAAVARFFLLLCAVAGFLIGLCVTASLLIYRGKEPVNVTTFLLVTVGLQLLVFFLGLIIWFFRDWLGFTVDFHPVRLAFERFVLWKFPGKDRDRLRSSMANFCKKREIYGSLPSLQLVITTQIFGVAFNLGILVALFFHVTTADLAFGWQSTLINSPEDYFYCVSFLSEPWSHFAANAHPTIAEVTASRFTYSAGMPSMDPAATASWWPFLFYAVVFYGLAIRVLVLLFFSWRLKSALRKLAFDHEDCNALFRRLSGTIVKAQSGTAMFSLSSNLDVSEPIAKRFGYCVLLISSDVDLADAQAAGHVTQRFWPVTETLHAKIDHPSDNASTLTALASSPLSNVVLVVRARRAPIKAIALFLQSILKQIAPQSEVVVLLVGRKVGEGFARIEDEEFTYWRNFRAIHRIRVSIEKWSDV